MRAEYWTVSARTGDGVAELFARVASLCFNAMVLRELEINETVPMNIGSDLISRLYFHNLNDLSIINFDHLT